MRQGCGGGAARHWRPSAMAANRGMVAGSRDGVVTIRHDGDGPTVRSSRLRALRPLPPRVVQSRFDWRGGTRRSAGWPCSAGRIASAPRRIGWPCGSCSGCLGFCRARVGDFVAACWSISGVDWLQCSPRHQRGVASLSRCR